jgi:hypothetical protein
MTVVDKTLGDRGKFLILIPVGRWQGRGGMEQHQRTGASRVSGTLQSALLLAPQT